MPYRVEVERKRPGQVSGTSLDVIGAFVTDKPCLYSSGGGLYPDISVEMARFLEKCDHKPITPEDELVFYAEWITQEEFEEFQKQTDA